MMPQRLFAHHLLTRIFAAAAMFAFAVTASAENWPRWRGPQGTAVSAETHLPLRWSERKNVAWKAGLPGDGSSSPIVWEDRVFVAYARNLGSLRGMLCLDRSTGKTLWTREITDENPEIASALTGHAAATPATDGQRVVAAFGNAGVVCYDVQGELLWHRRLGEFESELGLASSPVIHNDEVFLVCDHDGSRFRSFDSFLIALDLQSGETRWKTERPGLFRSWSTPILAPVGDAFELVVSAQDELRGYDPGKGGVLWRVTGMTGWVAPSPVCAHNLIFATSGKDGPTLAVRPGGRGDVTETHVAWQQTRGAPYVCSPLVVGDFLYVHTEQGVLTCRRAATGEEVYRRRLDGKFTASAVAGGDQIYLTNEAGETFVLKPGETFEILAKNSVQEECLASPAISNHCLYLRTSRSLFCIH